ncbi:MAG TPA: hypothetical protein VK535_06650 [Gemmatimonadales bacterium]|nr:hypothetical protein [Gemmatimonadales bacterium]
MTPPVGVVSGDAVAVGAVASGAGATVAGATVVSVVGTASRGSLERVGTWAEMSPGKVTAIATPAHVARLLPIAVRMA